MSQSAIACTRVDLDYRVLERLGPRSLSAHLRAFADYLVFEFSSSAGGQHVNKV